MATSAKCCKKLKLRSLLNDLSTSIIGSPIVLIAEVSPLVFNDSLNHFFHKLKECCADSIRELLATGVPFADDVEESLLLGSAVIRAWLMSNFLGLNLDVVGFEVAEGVWKPTLILDENDWWPSSGVWGSVSEVRLCDDVKWDWVGWWEEVSSWTDSSSDVESAWEVPASPYQERWE